MKLCGNQSRRFRQRRQKISGGISQTAGSKRLSAAATARAGKFLFRQNARQPGNGKNRRQRTNPGNRKPGNAQRRKNPANAVCRIRQKPYHRITRADFFNPEDKALRGFTGCFLTLNLFPCFPLFSAPVVTAFAFRCITPSYRLFGAFSSFSFYSPSFCSPLRLFRVFFILLFYFPYLTLFSRLFTSFSAPVVFVLFSCSGQKMKTCER